MSSRRTWKDISSGGVLLPLIYVEIVPLVPTRSGKDQEPPTTVPTFSSPLVKLELIERCNAAQYSFRTEYKDGSHEIRPLCILWDDDVNQATREMTDPAAAVAAATTLASSGLLFLPSSADSGDLCEQGDRNEAKRNDAVQPVLYLHSDDPSFLEPWPCYCRAFAAVPPVASARTATTPTPTTTTISSSAEVVVTSSTLVRILPNPDRGSEHLMKFQLTGELPEPPLSDERQQDVLQNQNRATVRELTLRMKRLWSEPVQIGTTVDALRNKQRDDFRKQRLRNALQAGDCPVARADGNQRSTRGDSNNNNSAASLFRDGSLLVHSPDHGAGKTLLVQAIAQKLGCHRIHVIRPGPLFAKYGVQADAALETILHQTVCAAAIRHERVCVVLDHLEAMLPSGMASPGDAAEPALNGIASFLKRLTQALKQRKEVPFPMQNRLYNLEGSNGAVLSVRLCLVAIVTCPDDGWRSTTEGVSSNSAFRSSTCILDAMYGGRYRLPSLTATTRLDAFRCAMAQELLEPDQDLRERLPFLAASATWARGASFCKVARHIRYASSSYQGQPVSIRDFSNAMAVVGEHSLSRSSEVEFLASQDDDDDNEDVDVFASVGGNEEAKVALKDALALDPLQRKMMAAFGLSPPTGVLLYGCPGCGKTLLGKAVARLLRGGKNSSIGGAFVSLSSSDIVRAEVGSGEKLVQAAFETARLNSPSVVFIDEFQALFTERSSGGSSRLTTTLLQCMDDITRWNNLDQQAGAANSEERQSVVVLAATNTPWMVDKAFLRPGRFDRAVHVGLPDLKERNLILLLYVSKMKTSMGAAAIEGFCNEIAALTEGFSGADLAALCRTAAVRCLKENKGTIERRHFLDARENDVHASTSLILAKRIQQWHSSSF